ncbi:hypothetical protein HY310_01210, partial [Candidatus Microgenomates bacterium]|nr:hypothetical protein [Candidatus Microgenomates bacterium]
MDYKPFIKENSPVSKNLGLDHKYLYSLTNNLGNNVIDKLKADQKRITKFYADLKKGHLKTFTPAQKWLEENKSLVLEGVESLENSLSSRLISRLPTLKSYPSKIRILEALIYLVSQTDHQLNYNRVKKFIEEYQTESRLTVAELWAVPLFSQAILIDSLSFFLTDEKKIKDIVLGLRNLQKIDWG